MSESLSKFLPEDTPNPNLFEVVQEVQCYGFDDLKTFAATRATFPINIHNANGVYIGKIFSITLMDTDATRGLCEDAMLQGRHYFLARCVGENEETQPPEHGSISIST